MHMNGNTNRIMTEYIISKTARLLLCVLLVLSCLVPVHYVRADDDDPDSGNNRIHEVADPIGGSRNYVALLYDNTKGLPTSEANDIAQTSEGFLWIGSYSGLVRYDGNTFEHVDSTSGITSVKCLFVDSKDRLWIGTNDNGVLVMERGEFRRYGMAEGLQSNAVRDITEDLRGVIYVATTGGVVIIDENMELSVPEDPRIGDDFIIQLEMGDNGLIYGVDNSGSAFTIFDGRIVDYISYEDSNVKGIGCIYPDPVNIGYVYIESEYSGVFHASMGENFTDLKQINIEPLSQVQSFEWISGRIWVCTRNGIGVIDGDGFHLLDKVPMDNSIGHVMADYEGNLWFTSTRQGVMKITANRFSSVFDWYDLPEKVVNSTCMYDGMLFVATDSGLVVLNEDGPVHDVPLTRAETASGVSLNSDNLVKLLEGTRIRSIIRDSQDRLWIATWRSKCGILRYDHGEAVAFTMAEGLFSDHIRTVSECADGSILVANTGGVTVIRGDEVVGSYGGEAGLDNTEILTVCEGKEGDIMLGSDGGGIYIISEQGTQHIGSKEGLTSGAVMRIKPDRARGIYWVVTGNSIGYLSADYQLHIISNFPYSNNFDLYENSRGEMWILSSNGIHVVPVDELLANGTITPSHYGISSGLPCITTANSYSELTSDGTLYIAGNTGVARVNIEDSLDQVSDLKIAVPYIDVDGVRVYPDAQGNFSVSADARKLTIYSYVFNYSLTDPQVTYYLQGFDRNETTVSRSELDPVDYTNLPGGTYSFVLKVSNLYSPVNKTMSVQITKEKNMYEYSSFYIMTILGAAVIVWFMIRNYVRYRIKAVELKHKEDAQKAQLVTELNTAARIQSSMLPSEFPAFPDRDEFDLYATMTPAKEVGGDFYDFSLLDDDHLILVIADVSGKGIPGALFMMISKVILQSTSLMVNDPEEILKQVNEAFCVNNKVDMFVTVWLGILEISTGKVIAANAGHEYPAVMTDGQFSLLRDRHGLVIGGMSGMNYPRYELQLQPGDKLFVYTDGVPEATSSDKQLFGTDRMIEALNRAPEGTPKQILENVQQAVDEFVGDAEQFDDLTMLCLEYRGKKKK